MSKKANSIMKAFICVVLVSAMLSARAGDGEYAASKIPTQLLKGADAVLRLEDIRFEVFSVREAEETNHYVITILNESGDRWADISEYYDKLRDIDYIEGILYDANGKQVKRIKTKDMQDMSGTSDNNLADDSRVKHHNFYCRLYPYTIEYTVKIKYKHTLYFPMWTPRGGEKMAVEKSGITVISPVNYQLRHKSFLYDGEPVVTTGKDRRQVSWSASNMPALTRETYGPAWHEMSTVVLLGPTDFQVDDYKGNMNDWQSFGKFVYALKQDKDVIPANVKQTIHQLTDAVTDEKKKVELLYKYMQQNTRYISIQLGIGGWRPFDANYVASKGYGDCKALTNYMYSLLKEAGIKSYYTLIRAGSNSEYITDDFPSQQFNHVILCVPTSRDTVWLECTSQTLAPGYLSDFTCNRFALMIDENGGKLVRTPRYDYKDNLEIRNILAAVDEAGTLQVDVVTKYKALQQDNLHGMITSLSKQKVMEQLKEEIDLPQYDVLKYDYKEESSSLPVITETLQITASNYAQVSGKRLFITPNILTKTSQKLLQDENRKYDVLLKMEYTDIDTVIIKVPVGYQPEAMPQPVVLESKFGKYSSAVKIDNEKITYFRRMERYSGRFPAKDYNELAKFYDQVYKADRSKVVLVKQN
jgi:transglutaminase-like putative cysteine protease